jgi:hypothetical protein
MLIGKGAEVAIKIHLSGRAEENDPSSQFYSIPNSDLMAVNVYVR